MPPVGSYVSALSTMRERRTSDAHSSGRSSGHASLHCRQKPSVSVSACSGSIRGGVSRCEGNHVRTNGTRSPSSTDTSEIVCMFSPRVGAGVRKQSASGPARATRVSSSWVRFRTQGTMRP